MINLERYICVQECWELDSEGIRHCIDTKEGIESREEKVHDYCPCGNIAKWKLIQKLSKTNVKERETNNETK